MKKIILVALIATVVSISLTTMALSEESFPVFVFQGEDGSRLNLVGFGFNDAGPFLLTHTVFSEKGLEAYKGKVASSLGEGESDKIATMLSKWTLNKEITEYRLSEVILLDNGGKYITKKRLPDSPWSPLDKSEPMKKLQDWAKQNNAVDCARVAFFPEEYANQEVYMGGIYPFQIKNMSGKTYIYYHDTRQETRGIPGMGEGVVLSIGKNMSMSLFDLGPELKESSLAVRGLISSFSPTFGDPYYMIEVKAIDRFSKDGVFIETIQ